MTLTSRKITAFTGTARIPGDKSMSHRALMMGGICAEETIISGLLESGDVIGTASAMRALGAQVSSGNDGLWRVRGHGSGHLKAPAGSLDMGNSGTGVRLLAGLVAGNPVSVTFTGDESLSRRPMKRIIEPLTKMGAQIDARENSFLPMTVTGTRHLTPIEYRLPVASAQVKSAILLAGLGADGATTVIEPHATRDHTENMLRHFGATVSVETSDDGASIIRLDGPQQLRGCAVDIPGDASSAAFAAVAAILIEGADVTLPHVGINPRRIGLYETLREMGASIAFENVCTEAGEPSADLFIKGTNLLRGGDVPPERVPGMIDEFPILAIAAACADGTTRMNGLSELRVKESDRLLLMAEGLRECGVALEMGEDSLTIHGIGKPPRGGAIIKTAFDHRIAMSFLVLGMVADEPVAIDDASSISTSFPGFAELMNGLGADMS